MRDGRGIRGKRGSEEARERRLYGCPIHDSLSPLGSKISLFL